MNIAVFVSGRGSNLKAILTAKDLKNLVEIKAVISDKADCPALEIAKSYSIKTYSIGDNEGCVSYSELISGLLAAKIDLIVLAGFLKLVPAELIDTFKNKIINIHPALLPSFGGKGMYGMNVHKAVFESSAKVTGVSVHFVDNTYDTGKIIAQRCVDISDVSSPPEIADRVLIIEHDLLPFVIQKLAEGKVIFNGSRVVIK